MDSSPQSMDFEHWSVLARQDPAGFEAMRRAAISALIEAAPPASRQRLSRLQWRIDQERRLCGSPLGACVQISRMMWDSLAGNGGLLEQVEQLRGMLGQRPGVAGDGRRAKIIPLTFPRD